ncbi:SpoIIE family protein phosphatase [Asticcacaulis solisilvae]|uniref:SpoIIE family protein phosphatase n=1 Tax=Asticcacaulis solisilvae TaxID=1217274 RepID=UPI003FD6FD3D
MEIDPFRQTWCFAVKHTHDVGNCRRHAVTLAVRVGFDESLSSKVALIATEFATNLVKHAGGGHVYMRGLTGGGLELMSVDSGPGFDMDMAARDGFSTSGSPGTGLGAIGRLATRFSVYSLPQKGSVLVASVWPDRNAATEPAVGALCLPVEGETLCGDGWAILSRPGTDIVMLCDGLGHGPLAAQATDTAIATLRNATMQAPAELVHLLHSAMKQSRGAAIAIAEITPTKLTYAGIGNIGAYLLSGVRSQGLASMNGIVGHQMPKVKTFDYDYRPGDMLILYSDGLNGRWKIEDYPGLAYRAPEVIAGTLFRDFRRPKDDATIVAFRRS